MVQEVLICEDDFNLDEEYKSLCQRAPRSGAVVLFVGLVRDLYQDANPSDQIEYIELQHYAGMTEILCQEIVEQARQQYSFEAVRIVHRVGRINASEQIVLVGVVSQHRRNAFNAAQFIMDYLKTRATIWKKEVGTRGEHWVGLHSKEKVAAKRWSESTNSKQKSTKHD